MRRDVVRLASPSWNIMVLRRAEQHQFYMELTPLLFYFGAMVLRQAKCNSVCSSESITLVQSFLSNFSKLGLNDSKLYTPTLSNYGNCSRSTLRCFEMEMIVLVGETGQNSTLPKRLNSLSRQLSDKFERCPQCEVYKEEKAEEFLKTLLHILGIMCSSSNSSKR
ncbi:interleukin 15, like isoform X3 [Ictalurus furcatus]|uniref:interleukin 15, like isoform X3 n=1 Tax=Ictalurus furcatus TaxID=66913 RepID=UPI00235072D5|nr:interleukin 15, like isoform X3 [Ictalurus furcatus]